MNRSLSLQHSRIEFHFPMLRSVQASYCD